MALPFASNLRFIKLRSFLQCLPPLMRSCSNSPMNSSSAATEHLFDEKMLEFLVCPLSKQPLRYDAQNNELVSDAIGVAYPVVNGIPNLVPQDGRMLNSDNPIDIGNTKPDTHKS